MNNDQATQREWVSPSFNRKPLKDALALPHAGGTGDATFAYLS